MVFRNGLKLFLFILGVCLTEYCVKTGKYDSYNIEILHQFMSQFLVKMQLETVLGCLGSLTIIQHISYIKPKIMLYTFDSLSEMDRRI